jgi:hypothetical protein
MEHPSYNVNKSTARISFLAHELLDDHEVAVVVVVVVVSVDAVLFTNFRRKVC